MRRTPGHDETNRFDFFSDVIIMYIVKFQSQSSTVVRVAPTQNIYIMQYQKTNKSRVRRCNIRNIVLLFRADLKLEKCMGTS